MRAFDRGGKLHSTKLDKQRQNPTKIDKKKEEKKLVFACKKWYNIVTLKTAGER